MKTDADALDALSQSLAEGYGRSRFGADAQTLRQALEQSYQMGACLEAGERARVVEALHAMATSLTPPGEPDVQRAYRLQQASRLLARVILESLPNPQMDPTELLDLAADQVRNIVETAQSNFFRKKLTSV